MMHVRRFVATLIVALLATPQTPAMTGFTMPATEWTQLLNHAQLVLQLGIQAQILNENIKMFQQLRLSGKVFNALQWANFAQQIAALSRNIQQGQGLA